MSNEIDDLMDLDPIELTKNPAAIDSIIAYHRKNRALSERGIRPKKESGPKQSIDMKVLGLVKAAPTVKLRRV